MDTNLLITGLLWYVAFLFSTTCHEAAHAWAAHRGGDDTAYAGGQVTLDPMPHIRRETFGMVIMPWLTFLTGGWMMGWASAPYNPYWARAYPRRAAWMALAGPAANFAIVIVVSVLIQVGIRAGLLQLPERVLLDGIVKATTGGAMEGVAALLSVLFSLNLLLGTFNLMPFPPLDGFGVLGLFLPDSAIHKLMNFRDSLGAMTMIGLLVAWKVFDYVYDPVMMTGLRMLYSPQL
ncbi:MAG: site-2 protease family protein [Bryobacteraceae bacterium]